MSTIIGNNNYALPVEFGTVKKPIFLEIGQSIISNHGSISNTNIIECENEGKVCEQISNLGLSSDFELMPSQGEQVVKEEFYVFENVAYYCRQTHNRTEHHPSTIPALFTFYREDTGDLGWIENEYIYIDDVRIYNTVRYIAIQEHLTIAGQTPDLIPALWVVDSGEEFPEWVQPTGAHDAYNIGDGVTFQGVQYKSTINANVWSPLVLPSGWEEV